jgi:catechol 2,3-dioxygenase-like lactoylglutathione lyase family enzyme
MFAFAAAIAAPAQPPAPASGIVGIANIGLRVSDVDKEVAFLGKLGFEEAFTSTQGANSLEVYVKVNDRQFIEVYSRTAPNQPLGWLHVCYEAGDVNVLQKFYSSTGLGPTPVKKGSAGNLLSQVTDPSGNVTQFTQYMPDSRQIQDKGQHLGQDRLSEAILGFVMPVHELLVEKDFYTRLGFEAEDAGSAIRLTTEGAPDLRVEITHGVAGGRPQILLPVTDAHKAADQLRRLGVNATLHDKIVLVRDDDGNSFVLLETGSKD